MSYAGRMARQQADSAIKRDVIRALIELITNANDDYIRIESKGGRAEGTIIVAAEWRRKGESVLRVMDKAQGMSRSTLDECLGNYAQLSSGLDQGLSVRGYFGRGLKDAILGLGEGKVYTIKNGILNEGWLGMREGHAHLEIEDERVATKEDRERFFLGLCEKGNGTCVEIRVTRDDVQVYQKDNLKRYLETHYALRDLMSNANRRVELWALPSNQKAGLKYEYPVAETVLEHEAGFIYQGEAVAVRILINKSPEPLSTPSEADSYAEAGFVVDAMHADGQRIVLENTLFGFDKIMGSERFYGRVSCPHLVDLLREEQPVVLANRDGLDWMHPFNKALRKHVESVVEPLIRDEERRLMSEARPSDDSRHRERKQVVVSALNEIAKLELGAAGKDGDPRTPYIPPQGIGFVPQFVNVLYRKEAALCLRARTPDVVQNGDVALVESEKPSIVLKARQFEFVEREDAAGVAEAKVIVEGRKLGEDGLVTAVVGDIRVQCWVRVVAKHEAPKTHIKKREHGGIVHDIQYFDDADPKQRVILKDGIVKVFLRAPSVQPYVDKSGNLWETPQAQVLLAELVTEAFTRELAATKVRSGKALAVPGQEVEAVQREFLKLQYQYVGRIHEAIVEPRFRTGSSEQLRRRRPTKRELQERSASEID
jgi:hypothetical protein